MCHIHVHVYLCYVVLAATPYPSPVVSSPIPRLTVDAGVYFEYIIPAETFTDIQDGNTRQLTLQLLTADQQVSVSNIRVYVLVLICVSFTSDQLHVA